MHLPFTGLLKEGPYNIHTFFVLWKGVPMKETFLSAGELTCVQPEQLTAQLQVS